MIESILNSLKGELGNQIMKQANIPSDKLNDVFNVIGDSAKNEVVSQMTSGGLSNVMNLFSNHENTSNANSLQSNISNGIVSGLIQKLGLSESVASTISGLVVPALIKLITNKNNETPEDDPSPLTDIFGKITGSDGAGNILGNLFN